MQINNIIKRLLIRFPLFGNVIANLEFKFTTEIVPAPAFTDGRCIYYKQEFIDEYSDAEKEFIIAHEIFHVVLNHLFRNIDRDRDLLNYVEDGIINQLLIRSGLVMPKGLVYIEDALDYSTDDLYMKYLPKINEIKEWMQVNTFHMELSALENMLNEMYNKDLQDLMSENEKIRDGLLDDFQNELEKNAKASTEALGIKFPSVEVGKVPTLLNWKDLLRASLVTPDATTTSFYEVEMDGIIKKEFRNDESESESEIIIDTSGSMKMQKIKAVLRECKNILLTSQIRVGFCDAEFYGWNEIRTDEDIDKLQIIGRGGTNFYAMADSFTDNVDNKIVITDGECIFPTNRPDILWIIINNKRPSTLSSSTDPASKNINYIFIYEKNIPVPTGSKRLTLEKK